MNDELSTPLWLLSPLAVLGAGLMVAFVIGLTLQRFRIPKLYGAVIAGLLLGANGAGFIDRALLTQFQELLNGAAALVLFEVGRKMDLAWLLRSGRQGASLPHIRSCGMRSDLHMLHQCIERTDRIVIESVKGGAADGSTIIEA